MADTIAYMRDNLGQNISLRQLAQAVKISSSHLNLIFKTETGVTAMQYLKQLRMKKACELLDTTYLSVKEVAVQVGLNDASHFVRDFKKSYGQTPTEYRNHLSKGKRNHKSGS